MTDGGSDPVAARLQEIKGDMSLTAFAKKTEQTYGTMRKYLEGSTPGLDKAAAIAAAMGVNLEWLATGRGPKHAGGVETIDVSSGGDLVRVRHVAASASAGPGLVAVEDAEEDGEMLFSAAFLRRRGMTPNAAAALRIEGDSMQRPDGTGIPDGSLVLVDTAITEEDVVTGCVYVLVREDELLIKRIERHMDGTITLHSDNPRYSPERIEPAMMQRLHIAGRLRLVIREV